MMQIKPEEVSKLIKEQIKNYENKITQNDTGTILMIGDGIARVSGLEKCMANELVRFSNGEYGMALNLEENSVAIVMLGNDEGIREGDTVERTGKVVSVPVGEALIGRVVNALGQPVDGKGDIEAKEYRPIERNAPGIIQRKGVSVPLQTGIKAIDSMIPIGRGQRELIIGDRQTGKTVIALDTIINQKWQGRDLHLRGHRPEVLHRRPAGGYPDRRGRDGVYDTVVSATRQRAVAAAVHRPLFRVRDG